MYIQNIFRGPANIMTSCDRYAYGRYNVLILVSMERGDTSVVNNKGIGDLVKKIIKRVSTTPSFGPRVAENGSKRRGLTSQVIHADLFQRPKLIQNNVGSIVKAPYKQ